MTTVNMRDLRIVFMGTPEFARVILKQMLHERWGVVGVVTQPDRARGRKRDVLFSPVKQLAVESGLPVLQPERIRAREAQDELAAMCPDLLVTAAYGQILPVSVLTLPGRGAFNLHGSILPSYRGGAPIQWAIRNGEATTGVSLMTMTRAMDAGEVWAVREIAIAPDATYGDIHDQLAQIGAALLIEALPEVLAGTLQATQQDESLVTFAPTLKRSDEAIDWQQTARQVHNQIRSLAPKPGAFSLLRGEIVKILSTRCDEEDGLRGTPGEVVALTPAGPVIACGCGTVTALQLQIAGRTLQSGAEFARGQRDLLGTVLSAPEVSS